MIYSFVVVVVVAVFIYFFHVNLNLQRRVTHSELGLSQRISAGPGQGDALPPFGVYYTAAGRVSADLNLPNTFINLTKKQRKRERPDAEKYPSEISAVLEINEVYLCGGEEKKKPVSSLVGYRGAEGTPNWQFPKLHNPTLAVFSCATLSDERFQLHFQKKSLQNSLKTSAVISGRVTQTSSCPRYKDSLCTYACIAHG